MLLDDLSSTVKRLSQLDKKESAIQNAAKKAQNDSEFSLLTSDYYDCMQKLKYAHDELGYVLSNDSYDLLSDSLTNLSITFRLPDLVLGIALGFITSIPELITFTEAQRKPDKQAVGAELGVVEATNNLLTSNLLNLFAIQSIGIIIYNLFAR